MVRSTDCDSVGCGFESRLLPQKGNNDVTVVEQLIDLQEVDGRIRELEHELKDLPRRKALETARLSGVSADLEAAEIHLKQILDKMKGYEADAEALREKIQQNKTKQASLTSNREYAQYSMQIDLLTHDLEATEQNWAASSEYEPSARTRLADAQAKFDVLKGSVDAVCGELDERLTEVKAALDEANKERTEKVAAVSDPKTRLYYERLRTKRWPVIVPLTHDGVCDGCHLVQPPSVSQLVDANVKLAANGQPMKLVACTMCGRLLYREG